MCSLALTMKLYEVRLQVALDGDLSESEVDEVFTNLDIDSSVATIHATEVVNYTLIEDTKDIKRKLTK